jgi:hypothetical protein
MVILLLANRFGIFTDFSTPSCFSVGYSNAAWELLTTVIKPHGSYKQLFESRMGATNSCSKAVWELQTAVLKPHGSYKQLFESRIGATNICSKAAWELLTAVLNLHGSYK